MEESERKADIFEETMAHMTYVQIEEASRQKAIVLFPAGVIEEHGPHLPLAVDVYGSYLQSRLTKSELERRGIKALIAPPFYWGINNATGSFGGSFTCREETVIALLWDAMACLRRWGFEQVFFINHHLDGGHMQALNRAIRRARQEFGIRAYLVLDSFVAKRIGIKRTEDHVLFYKSPSLTIGQPSPYLDIHAEGYETSFMWYFSPHLVDLDILKDLKPTNLTVKDLEIWRKGWGDARKVTPLGYFGDPTSASPERGKKEMEAAGKAIADLLEVFLQGRYCPPE